MADNERQYRPHAPRRNPHQNRPPIYNPGINKALNHFGVTDLREFLDRKHQEQGEVPIAQSKVDPKQRVNLPPPDPSYNFLKDPTRDRPRAPPPKRDNEKPHYDRPRDREQYQKREFINKISESPHGNERSEMSPSKNKDLNNSSQEGGPKKELRFTEPSKAEGQSSRGRHSFRGRKPRREGNRHERDNRDGKIENPINIKIELSTSTGQRNCTLDENTKIADIKHVPDKLEHHRSFRGAPRGGRGPYRGRGRGRGYFRGRGGFTNRRTEDVEHNNQEDKEKGHENAENQEHFQENTAANTEWDENNESIDKTSEDNEDYEDSNEDFNDSGESFGNYNDNHPKFTEDYVDTNLNHSDSTATNKVVKQSGNAKAESDFIGQDLKKNIVIASPRFQEGDTRSVKVNRNRDSENKGKVKDVGIDKEHSNSDNNAQ